MKIKSALRKRCAFCKIIKRKNKVFIFCVNGKHKQRQK